MHILGQASALAVLLVGSPVLAEQITADRSESELAKVESWLHDVSLTIRIGTDPVLRAIACRIPFHPFSLESLHDATKIPREKLLRAAQTLMALKLARIVSNEGEWVTIEPFDGEAEKKMRAWAYDWCINDESCDITW